MNLKSDDALYRIQNDLNSLNRLMKRQTVALEVIAGYLGGIATKLGVPDGAAELARKGKQSVDIARDIKE